MDTLASENKNVLANGTYVISSVLNSNYVFDVSGASVKDNANVQLYQNNDSNAQQFIVTHDSQGYVTFTNAKSGKVLDVSGGKPGNNKNIQQYASNGTHAQKWVVKKDGNGYNIISALDSSYVIDLSGARVVNNRNIQLYTYHATDAQRWTFTKYVSKEEKLNSLAQSNRNVLADGTYRICNALNSNYVLDISGGSVNNNANVQLYSQNGSNAQAFKVTHDSNGYVTFTNVKSGKVIDVSGGKVANNRNIQQYASNGSRAQKWIVKKSGSGYTIISAMDSNYVLDLSGGRIENNRNIQLYQGNGSTAQQWTFEKNITERERLDEMATQNKNMMGDGVYYIKNRDVKFALDVSGGSAYSGANVQLYSLNKTDAQKWLVSHDSKGYVSLKM